MITPKLTLVFDRKKKASRTREAAVELRITFGKVRKYISTGVKVLPKEWKKESVVGRTDWNELNAQLQVLKKKCSEIISKMVEEDRVDINAIPRLLMERMTQKQTFLEYAKDCAAQKTRSLRLGTKKRYKVVLNFLESWKGLVCFSDVTEQNIRKMDEYLEGRGLAVGSRYNYHKIVKMFVLQAFNDGLIKSNPYARIKLKRGDDMGQYRYLTPAEFHRFETCKITSEHLARVRDLFVFQTYTMMSYSDLEAFNVKSCTMSDGQMVYRASRVKTCQPFTIVLLKPALAILEKYNNKLPMLTIQKYNDFLKSAVLFAKIDKPVSTHWARHTGATMLLNEGKISLHVLQHMLGHASIRETERTYAKLMDGSIIDSVVDYQKSFDPPTPEDGQNTAKVLALNPRIGVKSL